MITQNQLERYLSYALGGSLVGQIAATRLLSAEEILEPDSLELQAIESDLLDLGIRPELLAGSALSALVTMLCNEANAPKIIELLTQRLWEILGDPKSGSPPEVYRKAGYSMFAFFVMCLRPSDD